LEYQTEWGWGNHASSESLQQQEVYGTGTRLCPLVGC